MGYIQSGAYRWYRKVQWMERGEVRRIYVQRVAGGYTGSIVSVSDGTALWSSTEAMTLEGLVEELRARGCHQTDIGDALYEADPGWAARG